VEDAAMILAHNVITKGRYYKAGEDIPENLLSDALRKYAISPDEERDRLGSEPTGSEGMHRQARLSSKRYVKRNDVFKRADSVETIAGEVLYKKDLNSTSPRFVRYGSVQG
jgi:hypothetical protein